MKDTQEHKGLMKISDTISLKEKIGKRKQRKKNWWRKQIKYNKEETNAKGTIEEGKKRQGMNP